MPTNPNRRLLAVATLGASLGALPHCSRPQGRYLVVGLDADGKPAFVSEPGPRGGMLYVGVPFGEPTDGGTGTMLDRIPEGGGARPVISPDIECRPTGDCNPTPLRPRPDGGPIRAAIRLTVGSQEAGPAGGIVLTIRPAR